MNVSYEVYRSCLGKLRKSRRQIRPMLTKELAYVKAYENSWPGCGAEAWEAAIREEISRDWCAALSMYEAEISRRLTNELHGFVRVQFFLRDEVHAWRVSEYDVLKIQAPSSRDIQQLSDEILQVNDFFFKIHGHTFRRLGDADIALMNLRDAAK